jgi:hypothetical protein
MPNDCCTKTVENKITVEENSKRATFLNSQKRQFVVCQIDGCEIKGEIACDYFLQREVADSVLVELKGRDISHAIDQIEATFRYLAQAGRLKGKKAGLIVAGKPSTHPLFTSKVQRAKERLKKQHSAPLHIVRDKYEDEMDPLFSFTQYTRS